MIAKNEFKLLKLLQLLREREREREFIAVNDQVTYCEAILINFCKTFALF